MVNEGDQVQFCGQVLFAVAATSYKLARKAAALAKVDYQTEEPITTIEQGLEQNNFVRPSHTQQRGNAKKAIEQGHIDGAEKGDSAHDAAVIGDTIGDPFKDTSGPSLNILIKLMSIVAVVLAGTGKLSATGLL